MKALQIFSPSRMAILRNNRKVAAVNRDSQVEYLRKNLSWHTNVHRVNEDYITQVAEERDGRVTKKLSQDFIRTESRILGNLWKPEEFRLNSQVRVQYGTTQDTSLKYNRETREYNEDRSQNDPHLELDTSVTRSSHFVNLDHDLVHHSSRW